MDPRLKERLIGAAVLVALGVWLIPWILDGPDPQPAAAPTAEFPADANESVPIRTRTIDLDRRPGGAGVQPETAQAAEERTAALPDEITDDPATVAGVEVAPSQLEDAIDAGAGDVGTADAADAERAPPDPPARVAAAADTRNETGGWVVQLGSFRDRDNADRQAARVTTYGFEPEVTLFAAGGQSMFRVRVGPYDSRGSADETASTLAANGFVAQVVAN